MAIIRNAANTIKKGRVGETTYYVSLGRQVARQALNNSNYGASATRTEAQQTNRVKWANLVNFYKASKAWMKKAYESKKANQTDYNRFMSINVPFATVSIPKDFATAGACVVEGFQISQGSLPPIEVSKTSTAWYSNISVGNLNISASTTVAEFSTAVVAANSFIRMGMQVSFVSYMQDVDAIGVPRVTCNLYEVTLSETDNSLLRDYLPEFCSTTVNGFLGTSTEIAIGGFAYIISELQNGKLAVSSQSVITNNATLIAEYSSSTARQTAIDSYGVEFDVTLSPLTTSSKDGAAKPLYIVGLKNGSRTYTNGSQLGSASDFLDGSSRLIFSQTMEAGSLKTARATMAGGSTVNLTIAYNGNAEVTISSSESPGINDIVEISVTTSDNTELVINFSEVDGSLE